MTALLQLADDKHGLASWSRQQPSAWRASPPPAGRRSAQRGPRSPSLERRLVLVTAERPARPAPVTTGNVRVTRRGRLTVLVAALVLVCLTMLAASVGRPPSQSEAASGALGVPALASQQLVIQPGDSLWTVARRIAPGRDPRIVVRELRVLNQLSDATVHVGQSLLLPVLPR